MTVPPVNASKPTRFQPVTGCDMMVAGAKPRLRDIDDPRDLGTATSAARPSWLDDGKRRDAIRLTPANDHSSTPESNQMVKATRVKLKVFQAQFGFYETVIATTSQAAALKAWGTHQNLFATGDARLCRDETAVTTALQHPQALLRRPVGSNDPFALEPTNLPKVPHAKKAEPKKVTKPQPPPRPLPDRSQLDAAEKALRDLDEMRKKEEAVFRREAEELEERRSAAQRAYVAQRKRASAEVKAAQDSYRKAGWTT
jgi:hypothetical protein